MILRMSTTDLNWFDHYIFENDKARQGPKIGTFRVKLGVGLVPWQFSKVCQNRYLLPAKTSCLPSVASGMPAWSTH